MKRLMKACAAVAILMIAPQPYAQAQNCGNDFTTTAVPDPFPSSIHVGVILVQFSDWQTNLDSRGGHCFVHDEDDHYTYQEFQRHLFSQDSYFTPDETELDSLPRTHDLEAVFGSMRDFFNENSYGKFDITGEILNDTTAAGIPIWVTLRQTRAFWDETLGIDPLRLLDSSLAVSGFDTSGFDKMVVLYSGNEAKKGLNPAASAEGGVVYQVGEKTADKRGRTQEFGTFYGIGTHSHEMGHLIGLPDLRDDSDPDHERGVSELGLMASGNQGFMDGDPTNTTIGGFHTPTHLCGWSKLVLGWANYEEFIEGNMTFPHFEEDDRICVYFINDTDPNDWEEGEYFIFENRRITFSDGSRSFDGDMQRDQTVGGLLIFHRRNSGEFTNGLKLEVIEADNSDAVGTTVGVAAMEHFFPGITNNTEFSPNSTPNSNDVNGDPTGLSLLNITNNNGVVTVLVDLGTPAAPQNLTIVNAGNNGENPILQWDANTETDIQHYAIYKGYQDSKTDPINWNSSPTTTTTNTTWTDPITTIDTSAPSSVHYRITAVDLADNESDYSNSVSTHSYQVPKSSDGAEETIAGLPEEFQLHANYPNPFNPHTQIRFDLPEAAEVTLKVFNLLGEDIRTLVRAHTAAGFHTVAWDGTNQAGGPVPSGIYLYRLEVTSAITGEARLTRTRKMTLLR